LILNGLRQQTPSQLAGYYRHYREYFRYRYQRRLYIFTEQTSRWPTPGRLDISVVINGVFEKKPLPWKGHCAGKVIVRSQLVYLGEANASSLAGLLEGVSITLPGFKTPG
jgi:hypothetical protein